MSILTTENLTLSFGEFDLFHGINIRVAQNSKIGLIGPNGIRKTSLLMILTGLRPPSKGMINLASNRKLAYLHQEAIEAFSDQMIGCLNITESFSNNLSNLVVTTSSCVSNRRLRDWAWEIFF